MKQMYAEHYDWAIRVARNVIGDVHEAEDVVSEVFLGIHRATLNGGGPTGNIRGYLRRAIQNEATRVWARRRFEQVTGELPEQETSDHADASLRAMQRERELSACPPMYTLVLFHMDVLGDDTAEVAAKLGVSVSSVKSMLHRARNALRLAA